jgi:hypothetical protein
MGCSGYRGLLRGPLLAWETLTMDYDWLPGPQMYCSVWKFIPDGFVVNDVWVHWVMTDGLYTYYAS